MSSEKEMFERMAHELLDDSTAIANSAITLAMERCSDLSMNPIICLLLLSMIAQKNAEGTIDDLPPHLTQVMRAAGIDKNEIMTNLSSALQKIAGHRVEKLPL